MYDVIIFCLFLICITVIICTIIYCNKQEKTNCEHQWKIIQEIEITDGYNTTGHKYVMQCSKCGNIKIVKS